MQVTKIIYSIGLFVAISVFVMFPSVSIAYNQGYYQGSYYSQGYYQSTYYSQSYYQSYYEGSYLGSGSTAITSDLTVTGNVNVTGALSKGSGSFVIDHPLDPKNKLLYHSFVESPDVKNIYDGVATLNENGEITIELPLYFLALNKDFRYLGTSIGEPMPNLHLEVEVKKRFLGLFGTPIFKISGGKPNGRISWQVTGIRHDPYILAYPINPEVEKGPDQIVDKGECIFEPLCK
jgi:hypothetical protein